ncbi:hypothetical protein LDENG_00200500, partial [Lucifuga dentata]
GPYSQFLDKFSILVADLVTCADNIIILGDFYIHFDVKTDPLTKAFSVLVNSAGSPQYVSELAHRCVHMLDLVLAHGLSITNLKILPHLPKLPDHFLITFRSLYLTKTNKEPFLAE